MDLIVKAIDLHKSFSIKPPAVTYVLKGVSLEIIRGEMVAIMGPSGVGKSTLLYLLGLLDKPDQGSVELFINGKSYRHEKISPTETAAIRSRHIGFVFQFHHLLPEFTALENVMIPALIAGSRQPNARQKARDLLAWVGVDHRQCHKPAELSGGEQQRVAIARALINNPSIIFADEPTGNLDSANSQAVLKLFEQMRRNFPVTFIIATHSSEIAASSERIINMADGKITD